MYLGACIVCTTYVQTQVATTVLDTWTVDGCTHGTRSRDGYFQRGGNSTNLGAQHQPAAEAIERPWQRFWRQLGGGVCVCRRVVVVVVRGDGELGPATQPARHNPREVLLSVAQHGRAMVFDMSLPRIPSAGLL